jgi:hypothetical protein
MHLLEGEEMNYREEITKLIRASYDQGAKDAQQEALAALEQMIAAARANEREKAKHNEEVLMNALWKACGDDGQLVEATIKSQGELK